MRYYNYPRTVPGSERPDVDNIVPSRTANVIFDATALLRGDSALKDTIAVREKGNLSAFQKFFLDYGSNYVSI